MQHPNSQSHLPEIGTKSAYKANRVGGAERCDDAAVQQTSAGDLALIPSDEALLKALARSLLTMATHPDAPTLSLWHTVPGIGQSLRLVLLSDRQALPRLPSGQDCASSARLVQCRKESAGKRSGTSGHTLGNAHRKWACAEAAVLCLRHHEPGQKLLARLANKHAQGKALSLLAHQLGRAVY